MTKLKAPLLFFVSVILLTNCSQAKKKNNANKLFESLKGEWYTGKDSIIYYETWKKNNDTLYTAFSYASKGIDTLFKESVKINYGSVIKEYVPVVNNQNGAKPVVFKIIELNDSGFVASNPNHDFPNTINYYLKKDSLIAFIEGIGANGSKHREYFRMIRK